MCFAQQPHHTKHLFHRIIGVTHNARTQKKAFDVISPVKLNSQFSQFLGCKSRAHDIVTAPVGTVCAVINTVIGQEYLKQRDAPPVGSEAVTNAPAGGCAYPILHASAGSSARCTRHIVLGGIGKDLQFIERLFVHVGVANYALQRK